MVAGIFRQNRAIAKPCRWAWTGKISLLAARRKPLYTSPRFASRMLRALRLAVQDAALSRRKHGFDSRRARQKWLTRSQANVRSRVNSPKTVRYYQFPVLGMDAHGSLGGKAAPF